MLLVEDSSVLIVTGEIVQVGLVGVCGRMWSGQYILSLPSVYCCVICYRVRSCVLYI